MQLENINITVTMDRTSSCKCTYTISLQLPPHSAKVLIWFFKDVTEIYFVNYCQSKNQKQCYNILNKILDQDTKRCPGMEDALFNCTEEMEIDDCGCLNSSLSLLYFYFVANLRKKIMAYRCNLTFLLYQLISCCANFRLNQSVIKSSLKVNVVFNAI